MGLINLLTDPKNFKFYNGGQGYTGNGNQPGLTNIPYGKDRIDGGSSGQPYIQIPIPDDISNLGAVNKDFILRGGTLAVSNSATDALRLTKMFGDLKSPSGLLFTAKQQILSRTAVRTQASGKGLNEGIYNPLTTIAQAGAVAFGTHLNKQSLIIPYSDVVTNEQQSENNRLYSLYQANVSGRPFIKLNGFTYYGGNNNSTMMSYGGGPGSTLGIGITNIKYSPTSQTFLSKNPTNTYNISNINSNAWLFDSINIKNQLGAVKNGSVASPRVGVDFRQYIREQLSTLDKEKSATSGQLSVSPNYRTENIEQRVNLGDPGQRQGKDYSNYSLGVKYGAITVKEGAGILGYIDPAGLDKINSLPIYRSENVAQDSVVNDLCKFRIAIIDNDTPNFKTFMHFRAFLGPISDSYTAEWNPVQYLGRGEKFYNYNGFTRQISLSWTVAAQSKQELIPMYKKLNYLASSLTPDYSSTGYMRGNLAQLTIGGYLYEQPGIITGLSYEIQDDTTWEIGINPNGGSDGSVKELPHIIRVTGFNFIPIQTFRPSIQDITFNNYDDINDNTSNDTGLAINYGTQRYIALSNGLNNNNNYDQSPSLTYDTTGYTPIINTTILDNGIPNA
jgi:hypothetical protein